MHGWRRRSWTSGAIGHGNQRRDESKNTVEVAAIHEIPTSHGRQDSSMECNRETTPSHRSCSLLLTHSRAGAAASSYVAPHERPLPSHQSRLRGWKVPNTTNRKGPRMRSPTGKGTQDVSIAFEGFIRYLFRHNQYLPLFSPILTSNITATTPGELGPRE